MVNLNIQATGAPLGEISDTDFRLLQSLLEEEGPDDRDYWINLPTIDLIQSRVERRHFPRVPLPQLVQVAVDAELAGEVDQGLDFASIG